MWLLAFASQLAVKRRVTRKHGAAKIGDTFQEITHIRILFLAGRRVGRLSLIRRVAEAIFSQAQIKGKELRKKELYIILQRNIY
ncbi:hypothetical protein ACU8NW_26700 (plasmid) [Rhizobium leguminosarum]